MNKVGMHIHHLRSEVFDSVQHLQPLAATIVNPSPQWIKDIHAVTNGQCYIGVRKFEEGIPFWERDPTAWTDELVSMCGDALPLVGGAITYNEPMPQGHDNFEHMALFDAWQVQVINRLQDVHGIDALAFAFGSGQFTAAPDRVRLDVYFPRSCEVARVLSPHDYGWPSIWSQESWHALRWLAWLDDIESAGYGRKKVFVSEWGLTQAVLPGQPDLGWRSGVSLDDYAQQMDEYNARVCDMPEVIAFCPFDWGGRGEYGWDSFEHVYPDDDSVVNEIFAIQCPGAPGPEPPNNGGSMLENIKVLKLRETGSGHVELTTLAEKEAFVYGKYGVAFREANVASGQPVYRLTELWEKTGTSALITQVLDENGSPMANVDVAFYWPDAPSPPDPPTTVYSHDWHPNFVHGLTNMNGDVGPGMGKGAYHGEGEGGPHAVWVRDPDVPSDICEKLGMLAGTFHDHLDQKFQRRQAGEPGNGGSEMRFVEISREQVAGHNYIRLFAENHDFYEMRGNLTCGSWEIPELVHPKNVDGKPCLEFDCYYTEAEDRTYLAYVTDTQGSEVFGGPFACTFAAGQQTVWNVTLRWTDDGEEPTPPPTSDVPARLRAMATELNEIADGWGAGGVAKVQVVFDNGTVKTFGESVGASVRAMFRRVIRGK